MISNGFILDQNGVWWNLNNIELLYTKKDSYKENYRILAKQIDSYIIVIREDANWLTESEAQEELNYLMTGV